MIQQQQTSTSLHESHQMLMQMQQPNMHHSQSSAMQQKNMNNVDIFAQSYVKILLTRIVFDS